MNDSKFFIFSIILALLPVSLNAQLRKQVAKKEASTPVVRNNYQTKTVPDKHKETSPDTVYCISTKKQHGWFMPLDVVTKEQGRKYGGYLMFTRKNALGHWTKFEKFDSYGNRSTVGFRPYILSDDDPQGDKNWIQRVQTGCICEIIADPQGENVVQERVYDKDMNLVYSFSHTPIGKRKYIGTYKDVYGLPAEMRIDSTFTYGTLVVITEDKWGNDSTIEYVDAKGVPKNNSNGAGMQIYVYDKNGRVIRQGSANHKGEFIIDNWGNCGGENIYDEKTGLPKATINMDNHWKPIPLPNLRKEAGWEAGTTKRLYKYDNDRRQIEERFVTIENKPDTNIYGAHCIKFKYDAFGNQTELAAYDINGHLAPLSVSRGAREIFKYDKKGRITYAEFYDKNNKLNSTEGSISRGKEVYGEDDLLEEQVIWAIKDGVEDTCYYFKRTKNSGYERYNDGSYEIDSLDEKGRLIMTAYYNADGSPKYDSQESYHRKQTEYIDNGALTWQITKYYDVNGELCGKYPFNKSLVDSLNFTELTYLFDSQERLIGAYMNEKDSNFYYPLSQIDINKYGIICRAGGNAMHYKAKVLYTQKGEFATFVGRDEFDEPDYICTLDPIIFYYGVFRSGKGLSISYDENNKPISDFSDFRNECPKAMSIEVTDSSAYDLGLKDNDIILRYGDSYQIEDSLNYHDFVGAWSLAQCLEAPREKQLLLFRINPETKEYGIVSLTLPKGNPSQLGFIAHPTFKTQKQRARMRESITDYCKQCADNSTTCLWNTHMAPSDKDKTIVVAFPEMYRANRYKPYPLQVTDPSIILAYNVPAIGKCWTFGQNADSLKNITSFRKNSQTVHPFDMYCLKNGNSFEKNNFTDILIGIDIFDYKVSKSQYEYLEKQYKLAAKQIRKDMHK
jgi:hypothetical protein